MAEFDALLKKRYKSGGNTKTVDQKYKDECHEESPAYIHSRMRAKTSDFLKVLNRARPEAKNVEKKTITNIKEIYKQSLMVAHGVYGFFPGEENKVAFHSGEFWSVTISPEKAARWYQGRATATSCQSIGKCSLPPSSNCTH
ncbi:Actin-related protein 2/3 complex subunit 2 [Nymphon striatum]|nr:Actin-related protein 2/3 complex subunit 2 [Nymphon striatum]